MKSLTNYIDEKLVINKNFKNDDYELNTILKNVWDEISSNNKYDYNKTDANSLFVDAAGISYDYGYTFSKIDGALDATHSFKKCKTIYILDSNSTEDTELLDKIFLTLRKKKIELNQLKYDYSTGFSVEYKETDDFIILTCGADDYYTFIGKLN